MKLFVSHNSDIDIFIKLGKKCPTGCSHCYYANVQESFFHHKVLLSNIQYGIENTASDFRFFLYGVDSIFYPKLDLLLDYIYSHSRIAILQIDYSHFSLDYQQNILSLVNKYKNLELVISRMLSSKKEILGLLKSFKFFLKYPYITIKYDLVIDFKNDKNIYAIFLKYFPNIKKNTLHEDYTFTFKNIRGSISKKVHICNEKKKIENIDYKKCIMADYFDINNNSIYLKDSFEIDQKGDFRIHTNLCFLGDIKISNRSFSRDKIIDDFIKFKKHSKNKDTSQMGSICYNCITSSYTYKN